MRPRQSGQVVEVEVMIATEETASGQALLGAWPVSGAPVLPAAQ
jgi:hypothetical protein